jgi:hypothetical protein
MVNHLKIEVSPNPEFDDFPDHQARIIVDGQDWLGTETIGLDPPDLDEQLSQKDQMIVGRCPCGKWDVAISSSRCSGQTKPYDG